MSFSKKVKKEIEQSIIDDKIKTSRDKSLYDIKIRFLECGSIDAPEKNHHLEYVFTSAKVANSILEKLLSLNIIAKISYNKKDKYVVYIKDNKNIMLFLKLVGAKESYKEYKDNVSYKTLSKNINRKVNFETANLKKIAVSSLGQIEDINKLLKRISIESLPMTLKEAINIRVKNPTLSLSELSSLLDNVSKSALNHRFERIKKLANGEI